MSLNHIFNPKCESPADMESGLVFLPNLLALSPPTLLVLFLGSSSFPNLLVFPTANVTPFCLFYLSLELVTPFPGTHQILFSLQSY